MRHRGSRAAAVAAGVTSLVPALLVAAPPAHAATAPWCDATSRVWLDVTAVTQFPTRIVSQQPTPAITRLCVTVGTYRALVEWESGPAAPLTLTIETSAGPCPVKVTETLSTGVDVGTGAVCVGSGGGRTVVRPYVGSGQWFDVDVWANYDCFTWIEGGDGVTTSASASGASGNDDEDDLCTQDDDQVV